MRGLVAVLGLLAGPAGAELIRPAELPPPDYAGQQYVDSRGCLFMRAGTPGNEMWLPRVTRDGVPLCGNPPSGRRVPVVEEGAAAETPAPADMGAVAVATGGWFVAVGSFSVAENIDRALARLQALNYPAAQGRIAQGDSALTTVFAGPFASRDQAMAAERELTGLGFPDAMVVGP